MMDDDTLCTCGHTLEDHHRWWLPGGASFADECEVHGSNELGGKLMAHPNGEPCPLAGIWYRLDAETGKWLSPEGHTQEEDNCEEQHEWIDHCFHFEEAK